MNTKNMIDVAGNVREGEQFDIHSCTEWIKNALPDVQTPVSVTQFSGGASNWTYRLQYANYDLVLRRPPAGTKAASAHDMAREYRIQKALEHVYPVPKMVGLCQDDAVIGGDFYVMHRIDGMIFRKNPPISLDAQTMRGLCFRMWDELIKLHRIDYQAIGLGDLGKGVGFAERQVNGWSERYRKAHTWNVASFSDVMDWLKTHVPSESKICLVHNDWRFDNLVLDVNNPMNILGVLDWELATLGDPLMDVGNALAYWAQADDDAMGKSIRRQPTHLPGSLTRAEIVAYYLSETNTDVVDWRFYEVFGLFRLAAIAQQIYYRYYHKQTRNPQFKNFWLLVNYLYWRCRKIIKQK